MNDRGRLWWLLVRMNRWVLAGLISVGILLAIVGMSLASPIAMRAVLIEYDAIWWIFSAMIPATITAVALVLTVNQLVLSQELGALGDQSRRMDDALSFRTTVEGFLDRPVAPADPARFLAAIIDGIGDHASALEQAVPTKEADGAVLTDLCEHARTVSERLEGARFGTFDVIAAALGFNYSRFLVDARRLKQEDPAKFSSAESEHLDAVIALLELYGPAREHFKTLHFQWELITLSKGMLVSAVPALLATLGMLLVVDPAALMMTIVGIDAMILLVALTLTVSLFPFVLLLSFVFRIASVAKSTLAMGPFMLRPPDEAPEEGKSESH